MSWKDAPAWLPKFRRALVRLARPDDPDRAMMAHLRRGFNNPLHAQLYAGSLLRDAQGESEAYYDAAFLASITFAWAHGNCGHQRGVNFGAAFGTTPGAVSGTEEQDKFRKQRQGRFFALVKTDATDLRYRLRQTITLLARDGVPIDWELFVLHLARWGHADRPVQKRWAQGFWGRPARAAETTTSPAPA